MSHFQILASAAIYKLFSIMLSHSAQQQKDVQLIFYKIFILIILILILYISAFLYNLINLTISSPHFELLLISFLSIKFYISIKLLILSIFLMYIQ